MDAEIVEHLHTLATEYVELVNMMRGGQFADSSEYEKLSSERTVTHDELLRITGMTRRDDMYHYCRNLLSQQVPDA